MSGGLTPIGNGLIEWVAIGGSSDGAKTDTAGYAIGDKTIILANTGTGHFRAGKRIKFNGDGNYYTITYGIADVSGAGLATSSTTDAAGYAAGSISIGIAAAGEGAIFAGNVINVAGDTTNYTVTTGINDVSAGGQVSISPALVQAIPAASKSVTCRNALTLAIGLRQTIATGVTKRIYSGGEIKRPGQAGTEILTSGVFSTSVPNDTTLAWFSTGQVGQLKLDQAYSKLAIKKDDRIDRSTATSGISQTRVMRKGELYTISIDNIDDLRNSGESSDLESILSIFEALDYGILLAWFQDYENRPTEFYFCTLEKRGDPVRKGSTHWHSIDFTLRVESGATVSIPNFGA